MIFSVVGSGENGVKWAFCRSWYRSGVLGLVWVKCLGNADFIRGSAIFERLSVFRTKEKFFMGYL